MEFKAEVGGGFFVKLVDGESVVGVFRGNPYEFKQHFIKSEGRSYICKGDGCDKCAQGLKPFFRFRMNFVMKEGMSYAPRIFEKGKAVYAQLKALHEGDYPLDKTIVRITCSGTGQQTNYMIMPIPKGEITPDKEQIISKIKLHDLKDPQEKQSEESSVSNFGYAPEDNTSSHLEDDLPF